MKQQSGAEPRPLYNSCVTAGGVAGHLSDFRETYGTAPAFHAPKTQLRPGRAWRLVDSYESKPPRHQLQLLVQRVVRVTGGIVLKVDRRHA